MKNIIRYSSSLLLLVLVLSACGPSRTIDDSLKIVPADISMVTAFNMQQLLLKADLPYVQSLDFYQAAIQDMRENEPVLASLAEQPTITGIDLDKNLYMVIDVDPINPKNKFIGFVFSITDQELFEALLQNTNIPNIKKGKAYNNAVQGNSLVVWNSNYGLVGSGSQKFDLSQQAERFFNNNQQTSIATNPDLKKCMSKEYDIATWINSDFLAQNPQLKNSAALIGISKDALAGNHIHSYLSFNQGDISGYSKHILQKALTNDLKLFFKDGIDENLSKYFPADQLGMLVGGAMDTKGIYQVLSEKVGGYAMVNKVFADYGFNAKDIANAFGGDVVLGLYNHSDGQDPPEALLAATINERSTFDKFIDLAQQFDMLEKQGEDSYLIKDIGANIIIGKSSQYAHLYVKEGLFFISKNEAMINTIKSGGYRSADRVDGSIYQTVGTNALGLFVDIEKFKRISGYIDQNRMPFTSIEMNSGLKKARIKVEMKDKNMNSLKALFNLMNEIYLSDQQISENQTI